MYGKLDLLPHPAKVKFAIAKMLILILSDKYFTDLSGKEPWQIWMLVNRSQFYKGFFKMFFKSLFRMKP